MPEIKMAVGSPELLLPNVDTVLDELVRSCYYLSQDGSYYRFSTSPNLNKILTDRRAGVSKNAIDQRLRKEIETVFKGGPKDIDLDRRFWPAKTNDVPDRPELTLVVLEPDRAADQKDTLKWMDQIVRECGNSGRTMKSALIFAVPESAEAMTAAVRDVLAWEEIEDDEETKRRLDDAQRKQLTTGVKRAEADLKEAIWRAYRRLYLLDKSNTLKETDLGQVTSSMAGTDGTLVGLFVNRLVRDDIITVGIGANRLQKYWPPSLDRWSTKAVRNAFYASPALPRLRRPDSIKRTIADGVTSGLVGYARERDRGQPVLSRFRESMSETDVEIADDVYILKAADAQKLLEPPRLSRLRLTPESVAIGVGEKATFSAEGVDQYGQPFPIGAVSWKATGGKISEDGEFKAGDDPGAFLVTARAGGIEGSAQVRIAKETQLELRADDAVGSQRTFSWCGTVPAQKWMNFYTKVVSRHAANPNLRLTVKVEVPLTDAQAATADETKAALRDLGLDDNSRTPRREE